jgi:hypothetical protein
LCGCRDQRFSSLHRTVSIEIQGKSPCEGRHDDGQGRPIRWCHWIRTSLKLRITRYLGISTACASRWMNLSLLLSTKSRKFNGDAMNRVISAGYLVAMDNDVRNQAAITPLPISVDRPGMVLMHYSTSLTAATCRDTQQHHSHLVDPPSSIRINVTHPAGTRPSSPGMHIRYT